MKDVSSTLTVGEMLSDIVKTAGLARELIQVVKNHLDETRNIYVADVDVECQVRTCDARDVLFSSVSYAACVEWALKQTMGEVKNISRESLVYTPSAHRRLHELVGAEFVVEAEQIILDALNNKGDGA